jgi:hypothetical protein
MRAALRPRITPSSAPALVRAAGLGLAAIVLIQPLSVDASIDPAWLSAAATRLGATPAQITLQALPSTVTAGQPAGFEVTLAGQTRRVTLEPHSLRGADFRVLAQRADGALEPVEVPPAATWRGRLLDMPGSAVTAARVAGEWHATLHLPRVGQEPEAWAVTPLALAVPGAPAGLSVVARVADLATPPGTCAVTDFEKSLPPEPSAAELEALRALSPQQMLAFQVACDADSEFYALNGRSVPNTVADIEAVLNGARAIYERDVLLTLQLGTVIVRTAEPDPYSATNPSTLLAQLRTEWMANQGSVSRDVVQLFTGKDLDGTAIGIAYLDGLCTTNSGYTAVQSRWSTLLDNRIENSTHELAHTLDAAHCDYDDYNCRIMCSSINGCSGGIHSFGPSEVTLMRAWLHHYPCLDSTTVQVNHASLPLTETFPGMTLDAARWTAGDRYFVEYGRLELDHKRGYGTAIYLGTVRTLPINLLGLPTLSYRAMSYGVTAGQELWVEYFETRTLTWRILNRIVSPGGVGTYATYTHTPGESARGALFALRFTAYGGTGTSGAQWYIDDVSISEDVSAAPEASPPVLTLLQVQPNPFTERAALAFSLAAEASARLELFDLRGARVRTLLDATVAAGGHECFWDGRDAAGRPVPSGLYLARLRVGGADTVTRIVRAR